MAEVKQSQQNSFGVNLAQARVKERSIDSQEGTIVSLFCPVDSDIAISLIC